MQKPRTLAPLGRKHTGARGVLWVRHPLARLPDARAPRAWLRPRRDVGAQGDARQLRGIFFVYIRACWQTLLWSVCHKRAINFCTHVQFPGQPSGRCTLAFLSAGASLLLPASRGVLYLLSRTGWALQLLVSPWPQLVHHAVTG